MRRAAIAAAVVASAAGLVLAAGLPAAARADGDPASDTLLTQGVFLPYAPNLVAPALANALAREVDQSAARGYPVRVAIIASPQDLGAWPDLFGDPVRYVRLLTYELGASARPIVLVVMPSGVAAENLGPAATAELARLPSVAGANPNALAALALTAIPRLAAAAGHPIAPPNGSGGRGPTATAPGGRAPAGGSSWLVAALAAVAAAFGAALVVRRRRYRSRSSNGLSPGAPSSSITTAKPAR